MQDYQVTSIQGETGASRLDLYSQVHKGIRAFLTATLNELGRLDCTDSGSVKSALDGLDALLDYCTSHLEKEERFVHPALRARLAESTARIEADHAAHAAAMAALRELANEVACAEGAARERAAASLYRAVARFVVENFEHMEVEETELNAALWAHFSDQELGEIHAAIVAASSPADLAASARWMIPQLSRTERSALLAGMRASMPGEAFEGIVALIRPHLSEMQWLQLAADLGLAMPNRLGPRELAQEFIAAVFVRFDPAAAARLVTEDFIAHPWAPLGIAPGPSGLATVIAAFASAFAEVSATIDDMLAEGDRIALRYTYSGVHAGELFGIPATGKAFRFSGIAVLRVAEDGRAAEYWREEDVLTLQRQLGLASLLPEHRPV